MTDSTNKLGEMLEEESVEQEAANTGNAELERKRVEVGEKVKLEAEPDVKHATADELLAYASVNQFPGAGKLDLKRVDELTEHRPLDRDPATMIIESRLEVAI